MKEIEKCFNCLRNMPSNEMINAYFNTGDCVAGVDPKKICNACFQKILKQTRGSCYKCNNKIKETDINCVVIHSYLYDTGSVILYKTEAVFICPDCAKIVDQEIKNNEAIEVITKAIF